MTREMESQDRRMSPAAQPQRAELSVMVSRDAGVKMSTEVTPLGLLSIAALVSTILLSTAVLVHVAIRDSR